MDVPDNPLQASNKNWVVFFLIYVMNDLKIFSHS